MGGADKNKTKSPPSRNLLKSSLLKGAKSSDSGTLQLLEEVEDGTILLDITRTKTCSVSNNNYKMGAGGGGWSRVISL